MIADRKSSISEAATLREIGEFWDIHDFADFDSDTADIEMRFSSSIVIAPDLLAEIETQANMHGETAEEPPE